MSKELFAQLARQPDDAIDLGLGALLIAEEEYPELDRQRWLRELDELGRQARDRVAPDAPPREAVAALARLLAGEHRFRGNQEDYYDPRNSFLNDVLERRTGIPITLAAVYVEVGRRAGLAVHGVGFPGHFLARLGEVVFDPFNGARVLSEDECRTLLRQVAGGSISYDASLLEPAPAKQILARMLNNLKQIYLNARYFRKAIGIMDRLLLLNPAGYGELRDRGVVHAELKQYAQARADLSAYLRQARQAEDAAAVRQALQRIDNVMTLMDD